MHLTDETWRWSRDERGREYYDRYWEQLIRYLGRARLLGTGRIDVNTDRKEDYVQGEPVRLSVRFLDERQAPAAEQGVVVVVQHESGARRSLTLARESSNRGLFSGTASNLPAGQYRAWLASPVPAGQPPATAFAVKPPGGEQSQRATDLADLRLAARRSGGRLFSLQDVESLVSFLPPGQQVRIEAMPPRALWNLWPLPLALLLVLSSEWLLRKRAGLL